MSRDLTRKDLYESVKTLVDTENQKNSLHPAQIILLI